MINLVWGKLKSLDIRQFLGLYGLFFTIMLLYLRYLNYVEGWGFGDGIVDIILILMPLLIITSIRLLFKKDIIPCIYAILIAIIILLAISSGVYE